MAWIKKCLFFILTPFILIYEGNSQCSNTFGNILGAVIENERGYTLTSSPDEDYIYVGGIKEDSAMIIKVSVMGDIQWTRTFDVVPGKADHLHTLFIDSDGMIAGAGTAGTQASGGTIFAFRYNPETNAVLWANEYISTSTNYCLGMIEIHPGGHFLLSDNPSSPNVAELIALERTTGKVITGFSRHYDLGSSESIFDFAIHNGYLYATGRFSDGGSVAEMRNTILKINPSNGDVEWMKLGHKNTNAQARLYGFDLLILEDEIFSIYLGDPSGTSVDNTLIYLQKTSLNGDIIWLKQFDLPITNDWVDEIIESEGDLVILARNRVSPSNMILFKTNTAGDILWSYEYDFSLNDNATPIGSVQSQLIEAADHYFFTAYAEGSGLTDMILVKTDLDGAIEHECEAVRAITIETTSIVDPEFYSRTPVVYDFVPQRKQMAISAGTSSGILSQTICSTQEPMNTYTSTMLCEGDTFMGYTETGTYQDTFLSSSGCDSISVVDVYVVVNLSSFIQTAICQGEEYNGYVESGMYVDTFASVFGCDSIRTLHLEVIEDVFSYVETDICSGEREGHHLPGMYTDTLVSSEGCDSIRTLSVSGAARYIPNVFSPNQDNINDVFEIFSFPDEALFLTYFAIFDRFGDMVYENKYWPIRWDGRDKHGEFYNPAVFTYVLNYLCDRDEIIETGTITLIR